MLSVHVNSVSLRRPLHCDSSQNFLTSSSNSSPQVDAVYLDLQKTFDTAAHGILLKRLWSCGITGRGLNVICLILPLQRVSITNNASGDILPVISGVPQGSILGPMLFIIYRNTITTSMQFSQLLKFADDTKCFMSIASHIDCVKF